jgi:predicted dehydrogenase
MITINCLGIGHWGPNLVKNFATHPETRIGAVCDISQERLALVQRNIPAISRLSTDPLATIQDAEADAIVIATPVETHYELTKAALEAGKHVLVEKPLCRSAAQAQELIALAKASGKLLCVGHVFLFNNAVRGVRNLIRSGELGRIRYISATRTNLGPFRRDVNALWDLASHDLSIFDYWLGAEPESVAAHGSCFLTPGIEDVVFASLQYPNGVLAAVHASWLNPLKVREITVVGEREMVVFDDMNLTEPLRIYHKSVEVEREPVYSDSFGSFRMQVRNGDIIVPNVSGPEPLSAECNHFVDCLLGRAVPLNDGAGALRVLRALEAADQSMREDSALVALCVPEWREPALAR